jgi:methylmalonyl-CoA mutase
MLKHTGEYPIIGVNTFLSSDGSPTITPGEVIRAEQGEKEAQIQTLRNLHQAYVGLEQEQLMALKRAAVSNQNVFDLLMEVSKYCSLGQITRALYEVGGQYRRNM